MKTSHNLVSIETFKSFLKWHPRDILKFILMVSRYNRLYPNDVVLVPYTSICHDDIRDKPRLTFVKDFERLFAGNGICRDYEFEQYENVQDVLHRDMGFLSELKYDNYVIAGDFPFAYCGRFTKDGENIINKQTDISIYLISAEVCNTKDPIVQQEMAFKIYSNLLNELQTIFKKITSIKEIFISRDVNSTTIDLNQVFKENIRIIHKIFPSKQSLIASFDQILSKVFYEPSPNLSLSENNETSSMIYFTLDAALCHYYGICPIDAENENPINLKNCKKYFNLGYNVLFPGLSFGLIDYFHKHKEIINEFTSIYKSYSLPGIDLIVRETDSGNNRVIKDKNQDEKISVNKVIEKIDFHPNITNDLKTRYLSLFLLTGNKNKKCHADYLVLSYVIDNKLDYIFSFYRITNCEYLLSLTSNIIIFPKIRELLIQLQEYSDICYYLGEANIEEYWKIRTEAKKLISEFPTSDSNLDEYKKLCHKGDEIITARTNEIDAILIPALKRLKVIEFAIFNFKPCGGVNFQNYWGSQYVPFKTGLCISQKFTMFLIWKLRKRENPYFGKLGKDIIFLLFKLIDLDFLKDVFNNIENIEITKSIIDKENLLIKRSREDIRNPLYPFPWHYISNKDIERNKYLSKVKNNDE